MSLLKLRFGWKIDITIFLTNTLRYERTAADYIEKLPKGKHSCKGVGKTTPDPSETTEIDGAQVPYGKGVKQSDVPKTDLLYNEYIVSYLRLIFLFLQRSFFSINLWTDHVFESKLP